MKKFNLEEDIAKRFLEEKDILKKANVFNDIPKKVKYNKVLKYIKDKSQRNIFNLIINLKINKENKLTKYVIDEFKRSNGDKGKIYNVLNLLKLYDKYFLVEKFLNLSIKKIKKNRDIFEKLLESESIITLIRNNSYSKESVKEILELNKSKIENNELILNHLDDTFTYDENLAKIKTVFNEFALELPELDSDFLDDNQENDKDIRNENKEQASSNLQTSEKKQGITGDSPDVSDQFLYNDDYDHKNLNINYLPDEFPKKRKKRELNDVDNLLISLFNTIQSFDGKSLFVKYIRDNEYENFENEEFFTLSDRYAAFVGDEINDLNIEINNLVKNIEEYHKISFHLRNLEEDALFGINKIIRREIILKSLIKKTISIIFANYKTINNEHLLYFISKEVDKEDVNINFLFSNLNELKSGQRGSKGHLKELELSLLDNLLKHYLEIDKEKKFEKKIINKIILDIKGKSFEEKIQILESIKSFLGKQIKNPKNNELYCLIVDYWIDLYRKMANIKPLSDDELLYLIEKEFMETHDIEKIKEHLNKLPDDKKLYFITQLSLNPKFAIFYKDIKELLFNIEGGSLLNNIILKIKSIEKQLGFDKCIDFLDDLTMRFTLSKGKNYFMVRKLEIIKDNIIKMKEEKISNLDLIKKKINDAKTLIEKIVLLKKMSKDETYRNFFSYIKKQQYVLIKNNLDLLLKEIGYLSIENQKSTFDTLILDLKEIFKNDPKSYSIIIEKFESIKMFLKRDEKKEEDDDNFSDFILQDEQNRIDSFMAKQEEETEKGIRIIRGKDITVMGGDLTHIHHSETEKKSEVKSFIVRIRDEMEKISSPVERLKKLDLWKKTLSQNKVKNSQYITVIDNYIQKINDSEEHNQELDKYLLQEINTQLKNEKNKYTFLREKLLDPKYKRIRAVISTIITKLEMNSKIR